MSYSGFPSAHDQSIVWPGGVRIGPGCSECKVSFETHKCAVLVESRTREGWIEALCPSCSANRQSQNYIEDRQVNWPNALSGRLAPSTDWRSITEAGQPYTVTTIKNNA